MFNFKKERLIKENPLGEGFFGKVYPYQKDPQDQRWVVKRIKMSRLEELLKCLPEIVIGFACDHPCIVPVKGYSVHNEGKKYYVHMKLPRMKRSLIDEFKEKRASKAYYSQENLVKYFYALVCGLDYLHNKKIFHGDIKLNNILLDEKGDLKLSDIGSAKYVPEEDYYSILTGANGTQDYKAPEVIRYEKELREYNRKNEEEKQATPLSFSLKKESLFLVDSWSLGLVMLELALLELKPINPHQSTEQIQEELLKMRKKAQEKYEGSLLELLFGLLNVDITKRLKVSYVKKCLEEKFQGILITEERGNKEDYLKSFDEEKKDILERFINYQKETEEKLRVFEKSITFYH